MKHLRNTRRGWMIFHAPDQGGAAGAVAEPPPAAQPQAGDDTSKSIFATEMAKVSGEPAPAAPEPAPPAALTKEEPAPSSAPSAPSSEASGKPSAIPADVLDPTAPAAPKVHDEVADILSAELPKGAKKEQIDSFGKLKTKGAEKLQAALNRAAELEAKINTGDATKAELAALEEKLTQAQTKAAEIEEQFAKVAFKESPKFKAQFADREQTALELAKSYLDGTEIKADIIDLAAHATGRKQIEILKDAGIDDATIQLISPHLANFATIQREKSAALDNWKATSKQEREQAQQEAQRLQAQRAEQENKVWEQVVSKLDILPLRKSKDNAEWNQRAEALVTEAKAIFNGDGADLPKFAETILKGRAYDVQQEVLDHLRTENASLRDENAKLKSAAPGGSITSGTRDGALPPPPAPGDKAGRERQAMDTFNAEKAKAGAA